MTEAEKLYVRNSMAMKGNGKMFFPDSSIRMEYESFRTRVRVEVYQYQTTTKIKNGGLLVPGMYQTQPSTSRLIGCGLLLEKHCDV